jgi:hypothetical protein
MKPQNTSQASQAYSLVEIVIVMGILSVILILGYRSLSFFTQQAGQLSRAALSGRKAGFDRFVGVLNDRLSESWTFTTGSSSFSNLGGTLITLLDAQGTNYANVGLYTDGTVFLYRLEDLSGPAPFDLTYAFTNRTITTDYGLVLTTNVSDAGTTSVTASWKVPPPFYYQASDEAFRSLFTYSDDTDLQRQLEQHRTNNSGLLQHDLRKYSFNPREGAFR